VNSARDSSRLRSWGGTDPSAPGTPWASRVVAFPENPDRRHHLRRLTTFARCVLSESADFDGDSLPFVHPCPTSTRAIRTCGL